jgi:hypothetical protein
MRLYAPRTDHRLVRDLAFVTETSSSGHDQSRPKRSDHVAPHLLLIPTTSAAKIHADTALLAMMNATTGTLSTMTAIEMTAMIVMTELAVLLQTRNIGVDEIRRNIVLPARTGSVVGTGNTGGGITRGRGLQTKRGRRSMRTEQMQSLALVGRVRARKTNIGTGTVNETPIARAIKTDTQTGGISEIVTMTTSVRKIALVRRTRIGSVQDGTARTKTKNNATMLTRNTAPRAEAAKTVIATGILTTTKNLRVLLPHAPFPHPSMHPQAHQQTGFRSVALASR